MLTGKSYLQFDIDISRVPFPVSFILKHSLGLIYRMNINDVILVSFANNLNESFLQKIGQEFKIIYNFNFIYNLQT